jgi:hypothetical protein
MRCAVVGLLVAVTGYSLDGGRSEPPWIDINRTVHVTTGAGDLRIRHSASWEEDGATHVYSVSNVSFDPEGVGLVSFTLPVPRGVALLEGSVQIPEGWQLDALALPAESSASPWSLLRFAPPVTACFHAPDTAIAVGQTASFAFRLPADVLNGMPYSEEMARYGVIRSAAVSHGELAPSVSIIARELATLAPSAVVDTTPSYDPGEAALGLGTPHGTDAPVFPGRPPLAVRLPDLTVTVEVDRVASGPLENGDVWLHVPITVENRGGAATWCFLQLYLETPLGVTSRSVPPIDAGAGREVMIVLHGTAVVLENAEILAIVDPGNGILEAEERNNAVRAVLEDPILSGAEPLLCDVPVLVGCPDLSVGIDPAEATCRHDPETGTARMETLIGVDSTGSAVIPQGGALRLEGGIGVAEVRLSSFPAGGRCVLALELAFDGMPVAAVGRGDSLGLVVRVDPADGLHECDESDNQGTVLIPPCE